MGQGMRVLVATDGAPDAAAAIEWIPCLLPPSSAVKILTVVTLPPSPIDIPTVRAYYEALLAEGERVVRIAREALAARGWSADGEVVDGDPRDRIVEIARTWKADLVVVGGRGLTRLAEALLGSVSTAVLRRAPCPVLVVKGRPTGLARAVVAVDGSDNSMAAARLFAALPPPKATAVRLLAVLDLPALMAPAEGAAPPLLTTPDALVNDRRAVLEGMLSRVAASYEGVVGKVECSVVLGNPAAEIISSAREPDVDLMVMGARGLGPIRRWLLGSVSERVLHHVECPVLVVPPSPATWPRLRSRRQG